MRRNVKPLAAALIAASLFLALKVSLGVDEAEVRAAGAARGENPSVTYEEVRDAFDPYEKKLALLRRSVLSEPGALDPAVRRAICDGLELPDPLGAYVRKVAEHAHAVSDDDIAGLHRAGYTDDQIFEATVSAALGAGLFRLGRILVALRPAS